MTALSAALATIPIAVTLAAAPAAAPVDPAPPSVAQLCAATGIDAVDALLDGVATTGLVGALQPLVSLTVPERDTVELDASVQLDDVRTALNCDAVAEPAPTTTPTPTPAPTTTPDPTPAPGDGFDQVDEVPAGAADTGGGPAT